VSDTGHIPIEDLSAWLDDDLEPMARERLACHLQECPSCRGELKELEILLDDLREQPLVQAPPGFVEKVMDRAERESEGWFMRFLRRWGLLTVVGPLAVGAVVLVILRQPEALHMETAPEFGMKAVPPLSESTPEAKKSSSAPVRIPREPTPSEPLPGTFDDAGVLSGPISQPQADKEGRRAVSMKEKRRRSTRQDVLHHLEEWDGARLEGLERAEDAETSATNDVAAFGARDVSAGSGTDSEGRARRAKKGEPARGPADATVPAAEGKWDGRAGEGAPGRVDKQHMKAQSMKVERDGSSPPSRRARSPDDARASHSFASGTTKDDSWAPVPPRAPAKDGRLALEGEPQASRLESSSSMSRDAIGRSPAEPPPQGSVGASFSPTPQGAVRHPAAPSSLQAVPKPASASLDSLEPRSKTADQAAESVRTLERGEQIRLPDYTLLLHMTRLDPETLEAAVRAAKGRIVKTESLPDARRAYWVILDADKWHVLAEKLDAAGAFGPGEKAPVVDHPIHWLRIVLVP